MCDENVYQRVDRRRNDVPDRVDPMSSRGEFVGASENTRQPFDEWSYPALDAKGTKRLTNDRIAEQ